MSGKCGKRYEGQLQEKRNVLEMLHLSWQTVNHTALIVELEPEFGSLMD